MSNKYYIFSIASFFEMGLSFSYSAIPLLAIAFGGSVESISLLTGLVVFSRMPLNLVAGHLSEKYGRFSLMFIGIFMLGVFSLCAIYSKTLLMLGTFGILLSLGAAVYYPSCQALVGDISNGKFLVKNLAGYNTGWCLGAALVAILSPLIVNLWGTRALFGFAVIMVIMSFIFTLIFRRKKKVEKDLNLTFETKNALPHANNSFLLIGRMGLFTGFFAFSAIRLVFPKIASDANWSESTILGVTGFFLIGEGIGVIFGAIKPYWKGKIYPQIIAYIIFILTGLVMCFSRDYILLSIFFFLAGMSTATAYTLTIFHALANPKKRGKKTGFNEALVATGVMSASMFGIIAGFLPKIMPSNNFFIKTGAYINIPFATLSVLGVICLIVCLQQKIKYINCVKRT